MNRIILADNQAIFRAGAARVLALADDMRIVAQCDDPSRFLSALEAHRVAVAVFSFSMGLDVLAVCARANAASSRTVLIAENGAEIAENLGRLVDGVVFRNVLGVDLIDFGIPEAMWHLRVENFPAIVTMDAHGNSLHADVEKATADELAKLQPA